MKYQRLSWEKYFRIKILLLHKINVGGRDNIEKQAWAELGKAHAKLEVPDAFEAEAGVEVAVKGWPMCGGSDQMKGQ